MGDNDSHARIPNAAEHSKLTENVLDVGKHSADLSSPRNPKPAVRYVTDHPRRHSVRLHVSPSQKPFGGIPKRTAAKDGNASALNVGTSRELQVLWATTDLEAERLCNDLQGQGMPEPRQSGTSRRTPRSTQGQAVHATHREGGQFL